MFYFIFYFQGTYRFKVEMEGMVVGQPVYSIHTRNWLGLFRPFIWLVQPYCQHFVYGQITVLFDLYFVYFCCTKPYKYLALVVLYTILHFLLVQDFLLGKRFNRHPPTWKDQYSNLIQYLCLPHTQHNTDNLLCHFSFVIEHH